MIRKTKSFFGFGWLFLFLALVLAGNASAEWTPNDDGEMVWWEPPVAFESMRIAPLNVDTLQENQGEINAEIIFAMDTSGSMSDEFDVLCNRITEIIEGVANAGINVGSHIYGIQYNRNCTENTVYNMVVNNGGTPTVNHSEDWGPAIVDLSKHYFWPSGHVRIVIPMSDESAQNGGWGYWDSADEQAANDAIDAAVDNSVLVIPVLCSGYNQGMLAAAQRMAQTTHGRYFTSTSPVNDLVDGIVNAIKDAIGSIEITGIYPVSYIEDAWQDPENLGVHKLPGDIVYLACSVNNSTDKNVTAKLTFSYPPNWQFVNDDVNEGVKKREGLSFPEEDVANVTAESGKAIISNISVPAKSGSEVGRTDTYLMKLVIPTNQLAGICPLLSFKVEWDNINDPSGQRFQTSEKILGTIAISDDLTRFILTNRNLMYERYGDGIQDQSTDDNGRVNTILANLYSFAAKQNAYIFYIDRWDFYDDFSGNNPDCSIVNNAGYCENSAPIALWDRENYYDCSDSGTGYECANYTTMNEADVNAVANAVDDYIHYWADQTGKKSNNHWLLIVGDDNVVPFYRPKDPTVNDPTITEKWTKDFSTAYDASDHTEEMAEEGWFFSESIYQDTDDTGWGDGDVDSMFVGRIVSNNSTNLNTIIENYLNDLKQSDSISADSFTFSSGEPYGTGHPLYDCNSYGAPEYREQILEARPYFVQAGYDISCQSDGTCGQACRDGNWSAGCLLGSEHVIDPNTGDCTLGESWDYNDFYFSVVNVYRDHGKPTFVGLSEAPNIRGSDITTKYNNPTFHFFTCLAGLVDGDNKNLFAHSFLNNEFSTFLGATTLTDRTFNGEFLINFYEKFTGQSKNTEDEWISTPPGSIGESVNEAKKSTSGGETWDLSNLSYVLYGVPWLTYKNSDKNLSDVSANLLAQNFQEKLKFITTNLSDGEYQKIMKYTIASDDYAILDAYNFQLVDVSTFGKYQQSDKLVLPRKKIKINVPLEATIHSISISATNAIEMGTLNIPIYNKIHENSDEPLFIEAPASLGLIDPINNVTWHEYKSSTTKRIAVDLIPVTHNTKTKATTLYKDIVVTVSYATEQKGILVSASSGKASYNPGDEVTAEVTIENTSSETVQFSAYGRIIDSLGKELVITNGSTTIDAGNLGVVNLTFGTITAHGNYFLEVEVYDSNGKIGNLKTQFSVSSGKITNFMVSETTAPGETASFAISFNNSGGETLKGTFKTILYKNSQFIGETNPVVIEIPSGQTETANFQWNVPDDFCGEYLALASVVFPGGSDSMSKDFYITSNNLPIADGGPDKKVEVGVGCMGTVTLDGSGSSDPEGDPLIYTWTWNGSSVNGVSPTIQLPLGTTTITLVVNDGTENSEPDEVDITVEDTVPPATQIISPVSNQALQDGVILTANASDVCDVAEVYFYVREADGGSGSPIGHEDIPGAYNGTSWECNFDTNTPQTPDGYYVILTKAVDTNGNEGWSTPVPVSIRNWAVVELLPNTANNKAGRTMPVKFALRIAATVDPAQPFVYNEELEIRIYDTSDTILQTSLYGDTSTDYRIDTAGELYITNFKTSKTTAEYVVEIWRMSKNFLVGSFTFETVK